MNKVCLLLALLLISACAELDGSDSTKVNNTVNNTKEVLMEQNSQSQNNTARATFAGGCFWCMEPPFENKEGVLNVYSGYTGGHDKNPTYDEVSSGGTGHYEAIEIEYDPNKVMYEDLLEIFWKNIDPTDDGGQFVDRGDQYRAAIFYHDEEQRKLAEKSKRDLEKNGPFEEQIVTEILPYDEFFKAEEYHQNYYKKNPLRYKFYRKGSGRDQFLEQAWVPSEEELKETLTPLQYKVTREAGTEPAFDNEYWNNTQEGIYVDIITGKPLFSSTHQFKSGTGWPSFTQPIEEDAVIEKLDFKLIVPRTEIKSASSKNHLGHVFNDGPDPTGLRYCMNSAALEFVPEEELEERGYSDYLKLFE